MSHCITISLVNMVWGSKVQCDNTRVEGVHKSWNPNISGTCPTVGCSTLEVGLDEGFWGEQIIIGLTEITVIPGTQNR